MNNRMGIHRRIPAVANEVARRTRWSALALALMLAVGCATHTDRHKPLESVSATTQPAPQNAPAITTVVYDVRDLLIDIPDFTNAPKLNADPTTTRPALQPLLRSREQIVREFIASITSSVDPLSWRFNTGRVGAIREVAGQLVVTQTPANQRLIDQKLQAMRSPRSIQIVLETTIITSPALQARLDRLDPTWIELEEQGGALWPSFLSQWESEMLLREARADRQSTVVTAPRVTLFNGQRAYVLVSRQTAYVADFKPKGDDFEPEIRMAESGLLIDAQARADEERQLVTLALRPQMATLLELKPAPWPQSPPDRKLSVQIPHVRTTQAELTVTMPAGQGALYRLTPTDSPEAPQPREGLDNALLLVRPHVIAVDPNAPKPPGKPDPAAVTQALP